MKNEDRLICISNVVMGVTVTAAILIALALASEARAGDTYNCIRAEGDYVSSYGPAVVHNTEIVVAVDSARHEQRWQPMLDPDDLRALIFEQARNTQTLNVHQR